MNLKTSEINEVLKFELVVGIKYRKKEISNEYIMKEVAKLIKGSGRGGGDYSIKIVDVRSLVT